MALFDITPIEKPKKKEKNVNIKSTVDRIVYNVEKDLGHHKDEYIIIREKEELLDYVNVANKNGAMALDTETTGLNPLIDKLVGICLYTPNKKAAYIPVNHISYITNEKIKGQLTKEEVKEYLTMFTGKYIMHNAPFDVRVLRHSLDLYVKCYWDTQLGSQCINELGSHKLKDLHLSNEKSTDTEAFTFDKLFKGITFDKVPISTAYLYAAGDAIKTYDLYEEQYKKLKNMPGPFNVMTNIEMPIVDVVCNMEDRGVALDYEVVDYLHNKYWDLRNTAEEKVTKVLNKYKEPIENYRMRNIDCKLDNPINISSPTQLAILLYDILKLEPLKKKGRSTDEDVLNHFSKGRHKELCESILEVRKLDKLIGTYIDKMPQVAIDGIIHAKFNQYGAKTGRFSSQDPRRIISNWGLKIQLIQGRAVA